MNSIQKDLYYIMKKSLRETIVLQVPNYLNNGFIEKTYGKSKFMINLYGMNKVSIPNVEEKKSIQV